MAFRLISREFVDSLGKTGNYPKGVSLSPINATYTVEYSSRYDILKTTPKMKKSKRFILTSGV